MRRSRFRGAAIAVRNLALRLVASCAASGVLVGLAGLGTVLTTQSRLVNLLFEPLSLFFLPGVAVAMVTAMATGEVQKHTRRLGDSNDFTPSFVVWCTLAFYLVAFFCLLHRRRRRAVTTTNVTSA